jgi:hypothetical protein
MAISEIGHQMKSIYTWIWITVFFFWLIFPIFVLLIKWFNLASITKAQNNKILDDAGGKLTVALILMLIPFGFTQLLSMIFFIFYYSTMEDWARRVKRHDAASGFSQLKTGQLISLIPLGITQLIGLLLFLFGFPKAGNGLL